MATIVVEVALIVASGSVAGVRLSCVLLRTRA